MHTFHLKLKGYVSRGEYRVSWLLKRKRVPLWSLRISGLRSLRRTRTRYSFTDVDGGTLEHFGRSFMLDGFWKCIQTRYKYIVRDTTAPERKGVSHMSRGYSICCHRPSIINLFPPSTTLKRPLNVNIITAFAGWASIDGKKSYILYVKLPTKKK